MFVFACVGRTGSDILLLWFLYSNTGTVTGERKERLCGSSTNLTMCSFLFLSLLILRFVKVKVLLLVSGNTFRYFYEVRKLGNLQLFILNAALGHLKVTLNSN